MRNGCCCLLFWLCDPEAASGSIESDYDGWPADWVIYLHLLSRGRPCWTCYAFSTQIMSCDYINPDRCRTLESRNDHIVCVYSSPVSKYYSFKANPPMISSVFVSPPSCCIVPQLVLYRTPGCYDTWWDGHASSPPAVAMPDVVRRPAGKNGCDRRAAGTNHAQTWGVAKRR
jgi:hypothetical protein